MEVLKEKIINALKKQGFEISQHGIEIKEHSKEEYRRIQQKAKLEQLPLYVKFLLSSIKEVEKYCRSGYEIEPKKISLELRKVQDNPLYETLFKWWNLIWWSMPYSSPIGRQLKFILWDTTHNAPFGLICLQSPILKISVLNNYLGIPKDTLDVWINKSMYAQRVGALPPYNELLGGKMVALTLTCNEIRETYKEKYKDTITVIQKRKLESELLFITTTSAFGKSSIYNRLKYNGETVAIPLGYTQGSGVFHIPEKLYQEILRLLSEKGIDISREFEHGSQKKFRLISYGLRYLGLSNYEHHKLKREVYLFPLVKNLKEVIQKNEEPIWFDRPFNNLVDYWKERWAIPRTERKPEWKNFDSKNFIKQTEETLVNLLMKGLLQW